MSPHSQEPLHLKVGDRFTIPFELLLGVPCMPAGVVVDAVIVAVDRHRGSITLDTSAPPRAPGDTQ